MGVEVLYRKYHEGKMKQMSSLEDILILVKREEAIWRIVGMGLYAGYTFGCTIENKHITISECTGDVLTSIFGQRYNIEIRDKDYMRIAAYCTKDPTAKQIWDIASSRSDEKQKRKIAELGEGILW